MKNLVRKMNNSYFIIILACLFFAGFVLPAHSADDLTIQASVDKNRVGLNQIFTITIEVSGGNAAQSAFSPEFPASMDAFSKFMGRGGESSNFQLINGKMSVSKSIQYNFMTTTIGKFTVESIQVEIGGKTFKTEPFEFEVLKSANVAQPQTSPQNQSSSNRSTEPNEGIADNLFLKASVNKTRVYRGEPVVITYKIYTKVNIQSYGIAESPNTAGFWEEEFEMPQQPKLTNEVINGEKYLVAEIKKIALFPTEIGKKEIDPLVINCDVRMPTRRRSRDIFDSFFDDPFFSRTQRFRVASTPNLTIEVLPLPTEGRPANFSGAVGNFKMSARIDKYQVETNESIKFKVQLSGTGNIKILPNPQVEFPEEFELYGPTSSQNITRENGRISGNKSFEYILIPRQAGTKIIKPIEFSYFDLPTKAYKTLTSPEIQINVKKGKNEFISRGREMRRGEIEIIGKDIRYIEQQLPVFTQVGKYYYQTPTFLMLLLAPLALLAVALVYRQRAEKLSGDEAYARFKLANRFANQRLKTARKFMNESTQKQFYAEVSKALMSFLANKLNLDEAGLMMNQVRQILADKNVNEKIINLYMDCLQICDFQRFAPADSGVDEMKKFYTRAQSAITYLQKAL